jgi:hypothetical protein
MWYDRQRLERLINENPGVEEDVLTRDLALYLFDNGISTWYRVRRGVHEYDLVPDKTSSITSSVFIEAKAYKSSNNARKDLIGGLYQLHSYINAREAEGLYIEEIYYVIYRLGGPLYDFPSSISMNKWIFYPIIVDLGPSRESGRKQPRPIIISEKDIFGFISDESNKETN